MASVPGAPRSSQSGRVPVASGTDALDVFAGERNGLVQDLARHAWAGGGFELRRAGATQEVLVEGVPIGRVRNENYVAPGALTMPPEQSQFIDLASAQRNDPWEQLLIAKLFTTSLTLFVGVGRGVGGPR